MSQADMLVHNLGLVLRYVRDHQGCSRTELANATGLTKPGVTKVVGRLLDNGLLTTAGQQLSGHRGRPADRLSLAGEGIVGIGLELRIDHVRAIAVDLTGARVGDASLLLEPRPAPRSAVDKIGRVVRRAMRQAGADASCGVGMAIGSTMDADRRVAVDSAWLGWSEVPIHAMVTAELGRTHGPLTIESAAALSGLATARALGDDTRSVLLHLEVGGGVGLGLVTDGHLSMPFSKSAIGHIPFRRGGELCGCGNRGCLDTIVGFGALLRAVGDNQTRLSEVDQYAYATRIHDRAESGDTTARTALQLLGREVGRAMALVVTLAKPDRATLGGYLLGLGPRFLSQVQKEVSAHSYPPQAEPLRIVPTPLGMEGAVIGAAALALESVYADPTVAFSHEG